MGLQLLMIAGMAYTAVAVLRVMPLRSPPAWLPKVAATGATLALFIHMMALSVIWADTGEVPVNTPRASVASLAVTMGAVATGLQFRPRWSVLSGVIAALTAVHLGVALLLPDQAASTTPELASVFFPVHIAAIFLGLSSFALAFGVSLVFLEVRRRLKNKQLGRLSELPPMDTLDLFNTRFVVFGFLALTVGIAAGGAWAASKGLGGALGPTVWATLVIWVWYAAAILVRVVGGWQGRLAASFSVVGFTGMLLSLGVTYLVSQGWHP